MAYTANVPRNRNTRYSGRGHVNDDAFAAGGAYEKGQLDTQDKSREINVPPVVVQNVSSEVVFYAVEDVVKMTGWSQKTVLKLFNTEGFPYTDLGKRKLVEAHALMAYFAVSRLRDPADKK